MEGARLLQTLGLSDPQTWWLFIAATAVLNATPGVDLLLTVTRTLQAGGRAGMAAACGVGAGCAVHALAAAFGLAAVLAVSAKLFLAIQMLGVVYWVWIAWGLFQVAWGRRSLPASRLEGDRSVASSTSWRQEFHRGLLTNVLNPKVALFFLAFVPQFIAPEVPHKTTAFLVLGGVFVIQGTLFLGGVVMLMSRLRSISIPQAWQRGFHGVAGALFVGFAWRLWAARPLSAAP